MSRSAPKNAPPHRGHKETRDPRVTAHRQTADERTETRREKGGAELESDACGRDLGTLGLGDLGKRSHRPHRAAGGLPGAALKRMTRGGSRVRRGRCLCVAARKPGWGP